MSCIATPPLWRVCRMTLRPLPRYVERAPVTSYAGLEGTPVSLPGDVFVKPSPEAVGFHRTSVFRSTIVTVSQPQGREKRQRAALLLPLPPPLRILAGFRRCVGGTT